ncbi:MAG: 1,4-alpha-glucan branching protein GlgB [Bacteroidota bacterium]
MVKNHSLFSDFDLYLFGAGSHTRLYEKFGSHITTVDGEKGTYFAVYAPAAKRVEVVGGFNYWQGHEHALNVRWDNSGIWEGFIPGIGKGELYKYKIYSHHDDHVREKTDPYARLYEMPPKTASVIWEDKYKWKDKKWMKGRYENNNLNAPISVYEVHLGSWKKNEDGSRSLHYDELAKELVDYVKEMNFTHVEFMPVMEHPFFPSWGYLCTGYFAPSSRYGNPELFKLLVDKLHENNIGVILDWVPAHFPSDEYALADFDGSALYEHPDRSKGFHPDWNSLIFNFERPQIRSFLLSSARFWLDQYHADGLRVDAVASMLYLDYSRSEGEWSPNEFGGNEYLAAIDFLKELNASMYADYPDILMIAEESTAFNGVTKPVHMGGLGFGLKWMMGWMNDGLEYFSKDPIHRKYHHHEISRSLTYAFSENYLLPLSHDEVVHGKGSLFEKMPGDDWQKLANVRLLFLSMYTHPGQKLLFMGCEFGQTFEWNVNHALHWELLNSPLWKGMKEWVSTLNDFYKSEEALYKLNYIPEGYEWIDYGDSENSVLSLIRKSEEEYLVAVLNFSPVVRNDYRIGVPENVKYKEVLNSDLSKFGGSNVRNSRMVKAEKIASHGREYSISITLPPLAGIIFKPKK